METETEMLEIRVSLKLNKTVLRKSGFSEY